MVDVNKRIIWADALRGLLILIVVLGHSLQFGDYENRLCWNIIYSFHMAAFFMISGYVSYKQSYQFLSLKNKAQQLLLPFITWSALAVLIKGGDWSSMYEALLKPDSSYWFIFVLFFIIALFILVYNIHPYNVRKYNRLIDNKDIYLLFTIICLILVMVITEFRLFGFQFFSLYFGFYVYGYWIRKYSIKFSLFWIVILGVVWVTLAFFWRMHEVPAPLNNINVLPSSILIYSYRYVTAFVGSIFFVGFAIRFMNRDNVVSRSLCYLGQLSMGIYIIHLFISEYTVSFLSDILNSETNIFFVLLNSISQVVISIILINLILRIPIIRLFLLGKK